jgi:hypothetical protein
MKLRNSRLKEYGLDLTGSRGGPVTRYCSQDEAHSGECLANLYGVEEILPFFCNVHCDKIMQQKPTKCTFFKLML